MRIVTLLTLAVVVGLSAAPVSQTAPVMGPVAPVPPKPTKVDFTIPMKPIKQPDLNFTMLKNRNSLLFYFSPNCGHCQHTYPYIQKFREKYEKKGMAFAALVTGYASPEDIKMFDTDFKVDMLFFQDDTKKFGQTYGTGSVPLMLLVSPDGTFQSWNASDSVTLANIETAIKKNLKLK
ncbi:MAG: redoxin family protein [Fibrobacterota bacterium]